MQIKLHLHDLELCNVEMCETTINRIYVWIFNITQLKIKYVQLKDN